MLIGSDTTCTQDKRKACTRSLRHIPESHHNRSASRWLFRSAFQGVSWYHKSCQALHDNTPQRQPATRPVSFGLETTNTCMVRLDCTYAQQALAGHLVVPQLTSLRFALLYWEARLSMASQRTLKNRSACYACHALLSPQPIIPLCQSRSSACYSLICLLRYQAVLAHTTLPQVAPPPSNISAENTILTQVLPLRVLIALHGTQGARCACYVLPATTSYSVKTQHCCSIGISRCYTLPDLMVVCFGWQAISGVGYHGQSAGCSAAQNMQG